MQEREMFLQFTGNKKADNGFFFYPPGNDGHAIINIQYISHLQWNEG